MTGNRSSAGPRKRHALQLFKTDMCKFFMQNRCQNGDGCPFAHTADEVRQKPDLTRTSMCKAMAEMGSCTDPACRFAHNEAQLRATHGFFKMKMCGFAQSGRCKHGDSCRFAHSREELRPAKPLPAGMEDEALMAHTGPQQWQQFMSMPESHQSAAQGAASVPRNTLAGGGGSGGGAVASQEFNTNNFIFGKQDSTSIIPPLKPSNERVKVEDSKQHRQHRQRRQTNQLRSGRGPPLNVANSSRRSTIDIRNENDSADASSWASGSSATELPRSEHTGSHPTTSDSSSTNNVHTTGATSSNGGTTLNPTGEQRSKRKSQKPAKEAMATTLLVVNVPNYLTQGALLSMLEDLTQSMRGNYDFYYCPWDEQEGRNKGYAILNFPDPKHALDFQQHWANRSICRGSRERPLRVMRASVQGREANLEYFSKVEITPCSELRFRPLYRDAKSMLQPLPLKVSPHPGERHAQTPPTFLAEMGVEVARQEPVQGGSGDVSFGQPWRTPVHDSQMSRSALQSYGPVGCNGARQMQGQPMRHGHDGSAMPQRFPTSEAAHRNSSQVPQGFPHSADSESVNVTMRSAAGFPGGFNAGVGGREEYWMVTGPETAHATTDRDAESAAGSCAQQVTNPTMMMTPVPWPPGPLVEARGQRATMSADIGPCHDSTQDQYTAEGNNCIPPRMVNQSDDHNTGNPGKAQQLLYHQQMAPYMQMMTLMEPMTPAGGNSRQIEQSSMSPAGSMLQMMPNLWFNPDEVYMD